jgi:hypothetical protein
MTNQTMTTMPRQTLIAGSTGCLPLEYPEGPKYSLKNFSFNFDQLHRVIADESAHFAVRISQNDIRVFTRACSFSINLNERYAQVALTETVWMTELVNMHNSITAKDEEIEKLKQSNDYKAACLQLEQENHSRTLDNLRKNKNVLEETRTAASSLQKKNSSLLSRCMKLVRKFKKTQ